MSMESRFSFSAESVPAIAVLGGILMMLYGFTMGLTGGDGSGMIGTGFLIFIIGIAVFVLFGLADHRGF